MHVRALIDTNVLVYAYDPFGEIKQHSALTLLEHLLKTGTGIISAQILAEFFVTVTRKIPEPLAIEQAMTRVERFCRMWTVLEINEMIIYEAVRGVKVYQFSYWDAQIWASARLNQAALVLSEDFSHNSVIEGIRFVNPFLPDFDPKLLF